MAELSRNPGRCDTLLCHAVITPGSPCPLDCHPTPPPPQQLLCLSCLWVGTLLGVWDNQQGPSRMTHWKSSESGCTWTWMCLRTSASHPGSWSVGSAGCHWLCGQSHHPCHCSGWPPYRRGRGLKGCQGIPTWDTFVSPHPHSYLQATPLKARSGDQQGLRLTMETDLGAWDPRRHRCQVLFM